MMEQREDTNLNWQPFYAIPSNKRIFPWFTK